MAYRLAWVILRFLVTLLFRWRVEGARHLPCTGPVLICSNHFHWADPLAVAWASRRPVHFMAKVELFRNRLVGAALRSVGAFPVNRSQVDPSAIKESLGHLARGRVLGIFPEGTRSQSGELQQAYGGAAFLAIKGRAPIVPVALAGEYRLFGSLCVVIGEPVRFEEWYGRRTDARVLAEISGRIMERISELRAGPARVVPE